MLAMLKGAAVTHFQLGFVEFSDFSRNPPFKVKSPHFSSVDNQCKVKTYTVELTGGGVGGGPVQEPNISAIWI
jgi:hypothetical protein